MSWRDRAKPLGPGSESKVIPSGGNIPRQNYQYQPGPIMETVGNIGKAIDTYTGAPARKALGETISSLQDQPGQLGPALERGAKGLIGQFGASPESAPTGKEIASQLGASERPFEEIAPGLFPEQQIPGLPKKGGFLGSVSPAGAAGLGLDVLADPTNIVPGAVMLRGVGKGAGILGKAAIGVGRGAAKGVDIATGTQLASKSGKAIGTGAEIAGGAYKAGKEIVSSLFNPTRAVDYPEKVKIAKKHGIDPSLLSESIEFGPNSTIATGERILRESPGAEKSFEKYNKGYAAIEDATDRSVSKLSGGMAPIDPVEAGKVAESAVVRSQEELLGKMDITYDSVRQYAPGLFLERQSAEKLEKSLKGLAKDAVGMLKRGDSSQKSAAREILNEIQTIRGTKGNYKQLNEKRSLIGRALTDKPVLGQVPRDQKILRKMYGEISDALINTIDIHVNPDFAKELKSNNKAMSDYFKNREAIASVIESKPAPEKLFSQVLGDTKKIESLKQTVSPEAFQAIRGSFLDSLVKTSADGRIQFPSTIQSMSRNQAKLSALFSPEELSEISEVLQLGRAYGPAIESTSKSSTWAKFMDIPKGLIRGEAGKKFLEAQKFKARGLPISLESKGLIKGAPGEAEELVKELPSRSVGLIDRARKAKIPSLFGDRGPIESRLKAAQSIAPSQYERKK